MRVLGFPPNHWPIVESRWFDQTQMMLQLLSRWSWPGYVVLLSGTGTTWPFIWTKTADAILDNLRRHFSAVSSPKP